MNRIKYYYSSLSRQFFLATLAFAMIVRMCLMIEVHVFNIGQYAQQYDLSLSIIMYIAVVIACGFFFFAQRMCFTEYNLEIANYWNTLTKRKRSVDLAKVTNAHFGHHGIDLFYSEGGKSEFYIPFFRFGTISPIGVDKFYNMLLEKGIAIQKDYKVLPGFGKLARLLGVLYVVLIVCILINSLQILLLVVMILQQP